MPRAPARGGGSRGARRARRRVPSRGVAVAREWFPGYASRRASRGSRFRRRWNRSRCSSHVASAIGGDDAFFNAEGGISSGDDAFPPTKAACSRKERSASEGVTARGGGGGGGGIHLGGGKPEDREPVVDGAITTRGCPRRPARRAVVSEPSATAVSRRGQDPEHGREQLREAAVSGRGRTRPRIQGSLPPMGRHLARAHRVDHEARRPRRGGGGPRGAGCAPSRGRAPHAARLFALCESAAARRGCAPEGTFKPSRARSDNRVVTEESGGEEKGRAGAPRDEARRRSARRRASGRTARRRGHAWPLRSGGLVPPTCSRGERLGGAGAGRGGAAGGRVVFSRDEHVALRRGGGRPPRRFPRRRPRRPRRRPRRSRRTARRATAPQMRARSPYRRRASEPPVKARQQQQSRGRTDSSPERRTQEQDRARPRRSSRAPRRGELRAATRAQGDRAGASSRRSSRRAASASRAAAGPSYEKTTAGIDAARSRRARVRRLAQHRAERVRGRRGGHVHHGLRPRASAASHSAGGASSTTSVRRMVTAAATTRAPRRTSPVGRPIARSPARRRAARGVLVGEPVRSSHSTTTRRPASPRRGDTPVELRRNADRRRAVVADVDDERAFSRAQTRTPEKTENVFDASSAGPLRRPELHLLRGPRRTRARASAPATSARARRRRAMTSREGENRVAAARSRRGPRKRSRSKAARRASEAPGGARARTGRANMEEDEKNVGGRGARGASREGDVEEATREAVGWSRRPPSGTIVDGMKSRARLDETRLARPRRTSTRRPSTRALRSHARVIHTRRLFTWA